MSNLAHVNIIGAGFAGIECALFLARHGIRVHIFNKIQGSYLCDCYNHIKNFTLREEARALSSSLIDKLEEFENIAPAKCPAGRTLEYGLKQLKENNFIDYFDLNVYEINTKEINIIASGQRTDGKLFEWLQSELGSMRCFNTYPIYMSVDGVNEEKCIRKGNDLYIPLNYEEYITLCNAIIHQRNENPCKEKKYECIEEIVVKNKDALRNHCMKPIFLGIEKPYAVINLKKGKILEGFCSSLPFSSQVEIIKKIKGLENAILLREGKATKNCYLNAPMVINKYGQSLKRENIFFAGNISGIFGHVEGMISGLYVARNVLSYIKGKRFTSFPENTCFGGLIKELMTQNANKFTPIRSRCDIIEKYKEGILSLKKYEEEINGKFI